MLARTCMIALLLTSGRLGHAFIPTGSARGVVVRGSGVFTGQTLSLSAKPVQDEKQESVQVLDKPDWAGGGPISDMVNFLISIRPLFKIMKVGARNVLIQNAEKQGIQWQEDTASLLDQQAALEAEFDQICNPTIEYPEYYTREFHGYDEGNLNWLAAAECKSATLSMATRIKWPTQPPNYQEAQKKLRASYIDPLREYKAEASGSGKGLSIVDVGCSVGISTAALSQAFPEAKITGLDLSPHFLATASFLHKNGLAAASFGDDFEVGKKDIDWIHAAAESTGLPSASVDIAMVTFVVHELPTEATQKVFAEMHRVLKPGGVMAVTDIDPKSPVIQNLPRAISTLMKSTEPWSDQYYSIDMQNTCEAVGFAKFQYVITDPRHSTYYATKL